MYMVRNSFDMLKKKKPNDCRGTLNQNQHFTFNDSLIPTCISSYSSITERISSNYKCTKVTNNQYIMLEINSMYTYTAFLMQRT